MSDKTNENSPDDNDALASSRIVAIDIEEEMKRSFMEYSMSVIVSRALPDVRDGLKPVHRRILYAMFERGSRPDRPYQKSARSVGDTMAMYHPHSDSAIYDSLVRMAQDHSMRYPLVDGHGNFGSIDFPPAAMRYTEARLASLSMRLLDGIDEDTVDFVSNYDGQTEEPVVLPARFPNLLVNGQTGIAVGMATNIPPHNLGEIIDAALHCIDHPDCTVEDLMQFVKGPDFPTAGLVVGSRGVKDAYTTGRGSIKLRAETEIMETRSGHQIVATQFPYQVSLQRTAAKIHDLVKEGRVEGIRDVRDESDKKGPRLVVELKRDAVPTVVLNNLYKHTQLQDTFGINMVALVDGVPRTLNLAEIIGHYVDHQLEVVERRTRFRLKKASDRAHILAGLLIALDAIETVIAVIRAAADTQGAKVALIERVGVTEVQATHILDMPLRRLTSLETGKLREELAELEAIIAELEAILADPFKLRAIVKEELFAIREKYAGGRRTMVVPDEGEFNIEDLIADDDLVITLTHRGYIKATLRDEVRTQGRGGRGVRGSHLREGDHVAQMLYTTAHAYLLFFSNKGKVYRIKAYDVPQQDRTAKGQALAQFLPVAGQERIQAIIDTRDYETARYLVMVTRNGIIKKTKFQDYDVTRSDGIIAIRLRSDDEVVCVFTTSGEDGIVMMTRQGMGIRFKETDVRSVGRAAGGVRGISLAEEDFVIHAGVAKSDADILCVTDRGYGKRTSVQDFRVQGRGGKGVTAMRVVAERGELVAAPVVDPTDQISLINSSGVMIRCECGDVSKQSRSAMGVRMATLNKGERITAVALAAAYEDENEDD